MILVETQGTCPLHVPRLIRPTRRRGGGRRGRGLWEWTSTILIIVVVVTTITTWTARNLIGFDLQVQGNIILIVVSAFPHFFITVFRHYRGATSTTVFDLFFNSTVVLVNNTRSEFYCESRIIVIIIVVVRQRGAVAAATTVCGQSSLASRIKISIPIHNFFLACIE